MPNVNAKSLKLAVKTTGSFYSVLWTKMVIFEAPK